MLVRSYFPKAPLSQFVQQFWFYEGYSQPHKKERIMPDGSMVLVINLKENESRIYDSQDHQKVERFPGGLVCGARSNFSVIDTAGQASVIGIHFKAGGGYPFFKLPAGELHNLQVSLSDLWGAEAALLREQILEACTPEAKFQALEQCLLQQAWKPLERHATVGFALGKLGLGQHSVNEVTDQIGLSARRFIQVFSDQVGLTPKLFCRVRRFQGALARLHGQQEVDWVEVALDCGYFDQAHFIHDFRSFSGLTPTAYMARKTEHLNHVPIPDSVRFLQYGGNAAQARSDLRRIYGTTSESSS